MKGDWHNDEMTRLELRIFEDSWFCGCGMPEVALQFLIETLELHPLHKGFEKGAPNWKKLEELVGGQAQFYLYCYTLDHFDLTEHGTTVGGAWLTDKGTALLAGLQREWMLDKFKSFYPEFGWCVHGYDVQDNSHECGEYVDKRTRAAQAMYLNNAQDVDPIDNWWEQLPKHVKAAYLSDADAALSVLDDG